MPDNTDLCLSCAKPIPPGPAFCSELCETAHMIAQTLHDLYGHTFDLPGFEAIKYGLEAYAKTESDKAIAHAAALCSEMANRYDDDIEGCDADELLRYTEGVTCASRLAKWVSRRRKLEPLPNDRDFTRG